MTWFKVDDGFWGHPKVQDLSGEAIALWTMAGSWCCRYLTDGVMPLDIAKKLGRKPSAVRELLDAKLWISDQKTIRFHDWNDYQDTKESVADRRKAAAERKRKSRMSRVTDSDVTASVTRESRVAPVLSSPFPKREERVAPSGALLKAAPAPRQTRKPDEAVAALQVALKASFEATGDVAPDVSGKPAVSAAKRLREFVRLGHAPDLSNAATRLVEACRALPSPRWPWCLTSEPLGRVSANHNSSITADGRTKHAW